MDRIFTGFYDVNNLRYKVINNPNLDSRVKIELSGDDEVLNQILSYKIHFKSSNGKTLVKEIGKLEKCSANEADKANCLFVDYSELKTAGMQSTKDKKNDITVEKIEAIYENGLSGYDYTVGEGKDYPYMIMQEHSYKDSPGRYIIKDDEGYAQIAGNSDRGYYSYIIKQKDDGSWSIKYLDKYLERKTREIGHVFIGEDGYMGDVIVNRGVPPVSLVLNPKMVSVNPIALKENENNKFRFSSIVPRLKVEKKPYGDLINGVIEKITLLGADFDDFESKHIYIDVFEKLDEEGNLSDKVRPTIKAEIDNNISWPRIDGLDRKKLDDNKYVFKVYANLYNDNNKEHPYERVELFKDGGNKPSIYEIVSGRPNLYVSRTPDKDIITPKEGGSYSDLSFNLDVTLKNTDDENYNIKYEIVRKDKDENEISLFDVNTIKWGEFKDDKKLHIKHDLNSISFVHGTNYTIKMYAVTSKYDGDTLTTQDIDIMTTATASGEKIIKVAPATKPTLAVKYDKTIAKKEGNNYLLDIAVTVADPDRVLENGLYYIKLRKAGATNDDTSADVGVGAAFIKKGNNDYVPMKKNYWEQGINALEFNEKIQFKIDDLEPNTNYEIVLFSKATLNDAKEIQKDIELKDVHRVYSADETGLALGNIVYTVNKDHFKMLLDGGTNFSAIKKVHYLINVSGVGLFEDYKVDTISDGDFSIMTDSGGNVFDRYQYTFKYNRGVENSDKEVFGFDVYFTYEASDGSKKETKHYKSDVGFDKDSKK